jgi:PTS system mannose-specific IIA component
MAKKGSDNKIPLGVVIVTHADFGRWLLEAAEVILGKQENCEAMSVDIAQEVEKIVSDIKKAVERVDSGAGVLLLTDMFGGTPTNLSLSLLGSGKLEVITGVNLPMLLKVLSSRTSPLETLAVDAKDAGCQGIVVAGELLRSKVAEGK